MSRPMACAMKQESRITFTALIIVGTQACQHFDSGIKGKRLRGAAGAERFAAGTVAPRRGADVIHAVAAEASRGTSGMPGALKSQ